MTMNAGGFRTVELSDVDLSPAGLRFATVKSEALRRRADVSFYVPPSVEANGSTPLVILLHGVYGSHWAWACKGAAHLTAQRLIDVGAIPPMVLAMPSDGLWGDGSLYLPHHTADHARWVTDEVARVASMVTEAVGPQSPRFLAGLSMGGFAALVLGAREGRARFRAVSAHSAAVSLRALAPLIEEPLETTGIDPATNVLGELCASRDDLPRIRFDCGREDDYVEANRDLSRVLRERGVTHTYEELPGGHDWAYWRAQLPRTLRFFADAL